MQTRAVSCSQFYRRPYSIGEYFRSGCPFAVTTGFDEPMRMEKLSKKGFRIWAVGVGVCVLAISIFSGQAPNESNADKILEWTAMVFLPLFGLHLDLWPRRDARIAGAGMVALHAVLVCILFPMLTFLTFVTLAPVAVLEMFVFVRPFLKIRENLDRAE